jgi:RNA ligase (TIGR02306 family)
MSTFEVKIRTITHLEPHNNADALECVVIGEYRAVVKKGLHSVGDMILYIPTDAMFTDLSVAQAFVIDPYLTGKNKNRVKVVRLRGQVSEGIVLPWSIVGDYLESVGKIPPLENFYEGLDLTDKLSIEKYEEPIPIHMQGQVRRWPSFLPHYDIENIKRPESLASMVEGEEVRAYEKVHGTNCTVCFGEGLEDGEVAFVCSRNNAIKESETNVYWRATRKYNLIEKLQKIKDEYYPECSNISLHFEILGVQDLRYSYENGDVGIAAFDIMVDMQFIDVDECVKLCNTVEIPHVPEIYRGPFNYDVLNALAHGTTLIGTTSHLREGLVVRPTKERKTRDNSRALFKFISEDYLLRKNGTENH